jgi:hypothetical protein
VNEPLRALLLTLLLVLGGLTVLLVVVLLVVRSTKDAAERLTRHRRDDLRRQVLTALLGEGQESARAVATLRSRDGRAWRLVERQAFAMLPKVKGDSRRSLVTLLDSRGAVARAHGNARARSTVRRSRGAYQLGALGDSSAVPALQELLASSHFLVRRTAVRALGQVGDPIAVPSLLDAVTRDPALVRDVVAALQRIGPDASPYLRKDLAFLVRAEHSGRRGALVATVLGLHGDIGSAPILVDALERGHQASLRSAAAQALGEIGVPGAVPALVRALDGEEPLLRRGAATALGRIGDTSAVPALAATLGSGGHEVDRAVAGALLKLGRAGVQALESHGSPYAGVALAVHRMRVAA